MSNQYMYSGDQAILIQDGAIIWSDQVHDQSSLTYFDAHDSIIENDSTNNESYVTAIDPDETQYLSILEQSDTNEITLEDLHNLTIENRDISDDVLANNVSSNDAAEAIQENNDELDPGEVIVFTMDGSDDFYGIQLTHDELGHVQKYQFKFRTTPEGQLEPIPETVTLLPNNPDQEEVGNLETESVQAEESEETEGEQYFLVQAPLESEDCNEEIVQSNTPVDSDDNIIEHVYIKGECHSPDGSEENTLTETDNVDAEMLQHCIETVSPDAHLETHLGNLCIKTEPYSGPQNDDDVPFCENDGADTTELESPEENLDERYLADGGVENEQTHEQLVQHFLSENSQIEVQYETELEAPERPVEECETSQVFKSETDYTQYVEQDAENVNMDCETEEYITDSYADEGVDVQEGPDVTADGDAQMEESYPDSIIQNANILKHSLTNSDNEDKTRKPLVSVNYYVVYQEKENVNSFADKLPLPKLTKSNPRSVLRASFVSPKDKRQKLATNLLPECDLYHKRFAKNKEAMQAKHFNNFLNRTTIPQAPVRRHRQPRKQEIKPVTERSDEEIIVQEVIVSSYGFVESLNKKNIGNKKVRITAVVELSDSEDDSNTQVRRNRRKTHHLLRKNPSESEISIIEINSDNEEVDVFTQSRSFVAAKGTKNIKRNNLRDPLDALKRRRGRPPKNKKVSFKPSLVDVEHSPSKNDDTVVPIVSINSAIAPDRKEITCPFCPKSFPSQNSLNTHIIHHNLENSLKNKAKMNRSCIVAPRKSLFPKLEYNHKCDECQETFKNTILLQKHNCSKKQTSLNCSVCLKKFRDIALLNIHKKSHAKSHLVKNTSVTKVSPKKFLHRASTSSIMTKSPKKSGTKSLKCTECPKVCDSEESLTTHIKMHKKFVCSSCSSTFSSKLLLDTHVRTNCVKVKTGNKRLSFTIRKSFVHTPPRRLSISKPKSMNHSVLSVKLECDKCNDKFVTFRSLYVHKVQKHGLTTPDKSLMAKPRQTIHKPKAAHGGIPANDRLKKAYAAMRKKLAESENLIVT